MRIKTILSILIVIFFVSILFKYFFSDSGNTAVIFLRISQIAGTLLFFFQVREIQHNKGSFFLNPAYRLLNIILGSMVLGTVIHFIYYGELSLSIAYGLAGAGVALVLIHRSNYEMLIRFMMLAVIILFFFFILMNVPARDWGKGSENHVSVFVIYMVLLYYSARLIRAKQPNPVWAFLALLLSLYAQGRGGIMAMSILFTGILTIRYTKRITTFGIAVFVASLSYIVFFERVSMILDPYLNQIFDRPLLEDPRMILNALYMEGLTYQRFIFGADAYGGEFSYNLLGLSTHNSYLSLHATFGVFFLPIMGAIGWSIVSNWNRQNYAVIFLLTILLRAVSDTLLFTSGIELTTVLFILVTYMGYEAHTKTKDNAILD